MCCEQPHIPNRRAETFSDTMELHTIELRMTEGISPEMAEWIEFLNAEAESDLESLSMRTHNPGIQEELMEAPGVEIMQNKGRKVDGRTKEHKTVWHCKDCLGKLSRHDKTCRF